MRRLSTFSLPSLLLLITVLCIFFAWHTATTSKKDLQIASSRLVEHALLTTHWRATLSEAEMHPLIAETAGELGGQSGLGYSYLMPGATTDSRGEILDKFEIDLVASLPGTTSGSAEGSGILRTSPADVSMYYQPVRATANCTKCHDGKEGDLLAVVKVSLGR